MVTDVFIVLICWGAVKRIEDGHKDFAPRFTSGTIEPDKFTLRFKNVPTNDWFNGQQPLLSAKLYEKFEKILMEEHDDAE